MLCDICNKEIGNFSFTICSLCKRDLSIKKYKKSDIMQFKSTEDIVFITNAITIDDLFT